jgi:hypothetical protein
LGHALDGTGAGEATGESPGDFGEVMLDVGDELVTILRVVVDEGEASVAGDEKRGGLWEDFGLRAKVLDERLAGEGHVFEAGVEFVEDEEGDGGVADFGEIDGGVDDGLSVGARHGVRGGGIEGTDGLGDFVFFDGEVVAGEVVDELMGLLVDDVDVEDDDAGGDLDGRGVVRRGLLCGDGYGREKSCSKKRIGEQGDTPAAGCGASAENCIRRPWLCAAGATARIEVFR